MARIRTIKPAFFRHEGLFDAEQETGLPLRLAFAGLWTASDREGRFHWRPRELKLDCLPHDDVDFSRVLDALATRGFIRRYASGTGEYGCIPSWHSHQVINNRESPSTIPAPQESAEESITSTREPRVDDACGTPLVHAQVEGKGKEGKGKEGALACASAGADPVGHEAKPKQRRQRQPEMTLQDWLASLGDSDAIDQSDQILTELAKAGVPDDFQVLYWQHFKRLHIESDKRQKDWRAAFRNAVRGNWYKLWWFTADGECRLTTAGEQARRAVSND